MGFVFDFAPQSHYNRRQHNPLLAIGRLPFAICYLHSPYPRDGYNPVKAMMKLIAR